MSRQRATGRKRRPRDTVAASLNQGNRNTTDLAAHEADKNNPHDTSLENLIDTDITTNPLLEGQGVWYDADTGLWKNRAPYQEAFPTGLGDGGELNIGPGADDIEVITGVGVVMDAYTNPLEVPIAKILAWDQINTPITAAPSTAGSVVWFSIQDTGTPYTIPEFGGIPAFFGQLAQYAVPPSPTLARQEIFLGVAVHNGIEWKEISNPKVIDQAAETLREFLINVMGPSFIIQGGNVAESGTFSLDQSDGVIWENNRNWHVDKSNPNREALPASAPISFQYVNQDFTSVGAPVTEVDPTMYDDGSPAPVPVPLPANNTTIQKLYLDPANNYWMLWGQIIYPSFFAAEASISADLSNSVIPFILQNSILLGYVVVEQQNNQWDIDEAVFIPAVGGGGQSGGGGTPITTFVNLTDTPASYASNAGKNPIVNPGETALEYSSAVHKLYGDDVDGLNQHDDVDHTNPPVTGSAIVYVESLSKWTSLAIFSTAAYGGIRQAADVVLPDIGIGWTTLLAELPSLTTSRGITQDFANNGIRFNTEGVFSIGVTFAISHNESNASRTINVRIFNSTLGTGADASEIGIARNQPITNYSATLLVDIDTAILGDLFQIQIGGTTDTLLNVVELTFGFITNAVSEYRG